MSRTIIIEVQVVVVGGFGRFIAHGTGSRRAISRSNRRNRIATRKKRNEKGRRPDPRGSNPHSYGDSFSVSGAVCGSQKLIVTNSAVTRVVVVNIVVMVIYPSSSLELSLSDWKSLVLVY